MQYNSIMYSATAGHSFARWPVRARASGSAQEHPKEEQEELVTILKQSQQSQKSRTPNMIPIYTTTALSGEPSDRRPVAADTAVIHKDAMQPGQNFVTHDAEIDDDLRKLLHCMDLDAMDKRAYRRRLNGHKWRERRQRRRLLEPEDRLDAQQRARNHQQQLLPPLPAATTTSKDKSRYH